MEVRLDLEPRFVSLSLTRYALLHGALAAMSRVGFCEAELNTSPERSPVAYPLYRRYGFADVVSWIALEKRPQPFDSR